MAASLIQHSKTYASEATMRISDLLGACAALLLFAVPGAKAQDKPAAETPAPEVIEQPAKLQIVLTEYEGTKKISSMPYSIPFILSRASLTSSLRMGVRVPVNTTSKAGESSLTYVDVGTNIDVSDIDYRINQSHLLSNPGRF